MRGDLTIPRAESDLAEGGVVRPRELEDNPDEAALTVILRYRLFLLPAASFSFSTDTAGLKALRQQTSRTVVIRVLRGVIALSGGGEGEDYNLTFDLLPHLHIDRLDGGSRSIPCPRAALPQNTKRRMAVMILLCCCGGEAMVMTMLRAQNGKNISSQHESSQGYQATLTCRNSSGIIGKNKQDRQIKTVYNSKLTEY